MHIFKRFHKHVLTLLGIIPLGFSLSAQASPCPEAALSQVVQHTAEAGQTLSAVASQYGVLPATLASMNPGLTSQGALPEGRVVDIPPFNGTAIQVGLGQTWQSLAESYGTRADLLFEVNGCPRQMPGRVFIPGSNRVVASAATATLGYPLPSPAKMLLSYGWQPHPQRDELVFNSGIALAAISGTQVISAATGTVAFVGESNGSLMVVVNHSDGLQTRYGNLKDVALTVGNVVTQGTQLGAVSGSIAADSFVYFEVRTNSTEGWVARDPGLYLPELDLQR
ncbi:MAG: M23 family metallopeptidase [Leptolyngbya sp. SIO3F4]|nr:M23 family metallopeptidase [Leptolyngbya sp. SIO3F4]